MVFVEYYGEGNPIQSGKGFNHGAFEALALAIIEPHQL